MVASHPSYTAERLIIRMGCGEHKLKHHNGLWERWGDENVLLMGGVMMWNELGDENVGDPIWLVGTHHCAQLSISGVDQPAIKIS